MGRGPDDETILERRTVIPGAPSRLKATAMMPAPLRQGRRVAPPGAARPTAQAASRVKLPRNV